MSIMYILVDYSTDEYFISIQVSTLIWLTKYSWYILLFLLFSGRMIEQSKSSLFKNGLMTCKKLTKQCV